MRTKEVYNFGVHAAYVESMLQEFNMRCLEASKESTDNSLGNFYEWTDLTCAVR